MHKQASICRGIPLFCSLLFRSIGVVLACKIVNDLINILGDSVMGAQHSQEESDAQHLSLQSEMINLWHCIKFLSLDRH